MTFRDFDTQWKGLDESFRLVHSLSEKVNMGPNYGVSQVEIRFESGRNSSGRPRGGGAEPREKNWQQQPGADAIEPRSDVFILTCHDRRRSRPPAPPAHRAAPRRAGDFAGILR